MTEVGNGWGIASLLSLCITALHLRRTQPPPSFAACQACGCNAADPPPASPPAIHVPPLTRSEPASFPGCCLQAELGETQSRLARSAQEVERLKGELRSANATGRLGQRRRQCMHGHAVACLAVRLLGAGGGAARHPNVLR